MDKNILKQYISDDAVILDAGAFNGNDSIDFSKLFQNSTIYSFEPVSHIYKLLSESTCAIPNIHTYNLALDDTIGEKTIYISDGYSNQSSSLLKPKEHLTMFPTCTFDREEVVQTITINKFVEDFNIDRIDFMWLDLQGNEHKVLKHADKILHTTKAIFAEYSLVEFYEGLTLYGEFKQFMSEIGFVEVLNENIYNYLQCGNSLFIRK